MTEMFVVGIQAERQDQFDGDMILESGVTYAFCKDEHEAREQGELDAKKEWDTKYWRVSITEVLHVPLEEIRQNLGI